MRKPWVRLEQLKLQISLMSIPIHQGKNTENSFIISTIKQEEMWRIEDEVLELYGWAPGRNSEVKTRFIYENCGGMYNSIGGNAKLDKVKELIGNLEDVVA